uniref:N-acetyltransferase domain-containing protein n=1 Tax=Leptobrachium leishanense TaxID=445787 RepID=A0A8C5QG70_9ANUR
MKLSVVNWLRGNLLLLQLPVTANRSLPTMTALSTPEIQILPATAADYEGVIAISEGLFMGLDYVSFKYHSWLKDRQRRMFVAKSEGKVVAFETFLLVDGGVTAVFQGLRVAPWMRGRRVAGLMHKFLIAASRTDHPDVTRIRLTRVEDPPAVLLDKYQIIHSKVNLMSLFHYMSCLVYELLFLSADELEVALRVLESRIPSACKDSPPPLFLDYSEVHGLFSGPLKEEDLLPERVLIQSWLPITTCKANLDLMQRWEDNISVSDTGPSSTAFKGFLSLGTPMFPVPLGDGKHLLDIDLFGSDLSCAKIHVLLHLQETAKDLPAGGSIICFLHAEESLRDGLSGLLDGFTPFPMCREQLVLEKDIKSLKNLGYLCNSINVTLVINVIVKSIFL